MQYAVNQGETRSPSKGQFDKLRASENVLILIGCIASLLKVTMVKPYIF